MGLFDFFQKKTDGKLWSSSALVHKGKNYLKVRGRKSPTLFWESKDKKKFWINPKISDWFK